MVARRGAGREAGEAGERGSKEVPGEWGSREAAGEWGGSRGKGRLGSQ